MLSLNDLIGKGYTDFWNCKQRYRVVKGSRGSKKSVTSALWYIVNMMQHPQANTLVVRRYSNTLRDSCYAVLNWAIERLGVSQFWKVTKSPLEMEFTPTGQKILFRGLDDGMKITSITVKHGVLCWVWCEESYELSEEEFNKLDLSIRGAVPKGLWKQITLTFNPWSETSWLKRRFFDTQDPEIFTRTTTYVCNEWLDEHDRALFDKMKEQNPRRYKIEALGEWGVAEGLIYENTECRELDDKVFRSNPRKYQAFYGLDFGFTDPTAFVGGFLNQEDHELYICYELYLNNVTNQDIAKHLKNDLGLHGEIVYCDSAEPKSIEELRRAGINAKPALKGADSVKFGIQKIQNYKIIYDVRCTNFAHEIQNYAWAKDKDGKPTDKPDHEFSHCLTGDTVVNTPNGNFEIKDLVGKTGEIYCFDGEKLNISYFFDCRMTREKAEIFQIELEDGSILKATADHLVYTKKGWKKVKDLSSEDCILSIL